MIETGKLSRRGLLGLAMLPLARAASLLDIDRIAGAGPSSTHLCQYRGRYRVHATITLLSVPLFSKANVGGACAMIEESVSGSSRISSIQFSSGSWPDRLKGFNRFGMAQEAVLEESGVATESAYLSFMTSSAEMNLDQAKKSFAERSASQPISVAHGRARRSECSAALDHLTVPAKSTWTDCPRLMIEMRDRLSPLKVAAAVPDQNSAYRPFLHTVRSAMTSGAAAAENIFVHNAKLYRLRTRSSAVSEGVLLTGKIAESGTNQESEFKVWFDPRDPSGMPYRFEFRPKSFLHLVFEQDPDVIGPAFSSLIAKEQA
ncbi:MAG TPA: hypothetical protein VK752_25625 [Bryobacteraceae bacterium]|jgi:hypothetical protein|nr:hypothetical protein [Bryobacteraceae bacterium]